MDPIAQIRRLGWQWRSDGLGLGLGPGVVLSVTVNDRTLRAFVPLEHVWIAFDRELQSVGCVGAHMVGAPFSVGGLFGFIKKAAKSAVKSLGSAAKAVVPKAIQRAAATVVQTARHYGAQAVNLAGRGLSYARGALPYIQTAASLVPGIGTGVSAGIAAATALARGQSLTDAALNAAKASVPGGPAAQAAFSIATDAMQGKPLSSSLLGALPLPPASKQALATGLELAKAAADGRPVAPAALNAALHQLPPAYQHAVTQGVALGHARRLQQTAHAATQGAMQLAHAIAGGQHAAAELARGVRSPALLAAVQHGNHSATALGQIVRHAHGGHPQARNIANAFALLRGLRPSFA